ncbi:MAG: histidine ammonia-lyase, partial [Candidatus Thermofonsia bacterium]
QGIDFRRKQMGAHRQMGVGTRIAYDIVRQHVPFIKHDTYLAPHIERVRRLVADGTLKEAVEQALGMP